jgi:hypothetical protein
MEKNHPDEKLWLVFLCDRFNFDNFQYQNYMTTKGTKVTSAAVLQELKDTFDQFAREFDVDRQLETHHRKGEMRSLYKSEGWDTPIKK